MATKTYEEYEVEQLIKAKKQAAEYEASRREQADAATQASNELYDTAIATAEKNYNASARETESGYRTLYDANAVSELVARKRAEEAVRNMGLTDSGLSRTEQTAISLQRGRADTETTRQKQSAVDAIMRELDGVRSKYESEKTAAGHNIHAQANADILNFRNNADAVARQNAASLYAADQERAAAEYAARLEAETAALKANSGTSILDQVTKLMNAGDGMPFEQAYAIVTGQPYSAVTARQEYETSKTTRGAPTELTGKIAVEGDPYNRIVDGDRAVLYRIGRDAKTAHDRGAFGTMGSPEASSGLFDYLKVYRDKGYITQNQMNEIIEAVCTGRELFEVVFGY